MSDFIATQRGYNAGRNAISRWLTGYGITLVKVVDLGMARDDNGWEHLLWMLTVQSRHEYGRYPTQYEFPYMQGTAHTKKPTLVDIMVALLSDASCVAGREFEEFCGDFGYDPDSRKAEALYNRIIEDNAKLCKLFGTTDLEAVLESYEPLRKAAGL
jgi:hypothetical protein